MSYNYDTPMAHIAQIEFCLEVKEKFPERFKNADVLDIGSMDINGNNRYLFEDSSYTGLDLGPGANVDVISPAHLYKPDKQFTVVVSTECFEHDMHYKKTLPHIVDLLKSNGLFLFTCASTGRPEHGTKRSGLGWASPHTMEQFGEYYKNLTVDDIREALDVDGLFYTYQFKYNATEGDLYFWGIKK